MKKLVPFLLLFISIASFSQEIKIENGKYYVNGKQISTRETKQLLVSNVRAITLFKEAKDKESVGGFLLGLGIGLTISDLAIGLSSDVKYPTALTYIGLGTTIISIPVLIGRKKKIEEAISIYNKEQNKIGFIDQNFHMNIIGNQNGIGLQIKF